MSETTCSNTTNESTEETIDLKKEDNLCKQLRKINLTLNSQISISLLNLISENKLKKNYNEFLKKQKNCCFNLKKIANISLGDFIYRILYYSKIEDSTLISALIYLDRYCKKQKIILTEYNIHRLFFICVIVAIKFLEDKYFTNVFYSKICGVKIGILNKMEYEFVCGINFDLYIDKSLYYKYENLLVNSIN